MSIAVELIIANAQVLLPSIVQKLAGTQSMWGPLKPRDVFFVTTKTIVSKVIPTTCTTCSRVVASLVYLNPEARTQPVLTIEGPLSLTIEDALRSLLDVTSYLVETRGKAVKPKNTLTFYGAKVDRDLPPIVVNEAAMSLAS